MDPDPRSSDPHLEKVDPDPGPKWIPIRVPIDIDDISYYKYIQVGQITDYNTYFCYRQKEKAFLR